MRRSLAPSVLKQQAQQPPNGAGGGSSSLSCLGAGKAASGNGAGSKQRGGDGNADVVIERMPLMGFLSIPDDLKKQFTIPKGCVVTEESIRLRKIKTLGSNKNFPILKPGGLKAFQPPKAFVAPEDDEDDGAEQMPTMSLPPFEPLVLWTDKASAPGDENPPHKVEVVPQLASKLRPHQREGVTFLFECTMGLRGFEGQGCILADDMGLGKTLMSITLLWTLMNQGFVKGESAVKKVVVACPVSLVGNWDNEIKRWVGDCCVTYPVKQDAKQTIKHFINHRGKAVLIISYDQQRNNQALFAPSKMAKMVSSQPLCDLLICDEAHKLKNADSGIAKSLNLLPAKKRVLLSGTPMQNELEEFFNMVNFCNPGVLGSLSEFKKRYERPILASREPDASPASISKAAALQKELSTIVNEFILKRGNALNAQHLPPKLVQYICCRPTPEQAKMYDELIQAKQLNHLLAGKQEDTLSYIRYLIRICCHPKLIFDTYAESCKTGKPVELLQNVAKIYSTALPLPAVRDDANRRANAVPRPTLPGKGGAGGKAGGGGGVSSADYVDPARSGKLTVLFRMMQTMRAEKNGERIVVVSNYTSVLNMIELVCKANNWPSVMLSGDTAGVKRTKLVDEFNDPMKSIFCFLLSSKAGGCGINLIGGNRLVLFDADWNPANDKQAAGRIWREGQKRRCYIYRFVTTGTIEEKIIQRQLNKESLQNIVDDRDSFANISTAELKNLFMRADETPSDTHDTLRCKRCKSVCVVDTLADIAAKKRLNEAQRDVCLTFLDELTQFLCNAAERNPLNKIYPSSDGAEDGDGGAAPELATFRAFDRTDLDNLAHQLRSNAFATVPEFSKKLRETITALCRRLDDPDDDCPSDGGMLPPDVSLMDEFVRRWAAIVPKITELQTKRAAPSAAAAAAAAAAALSEVCAKNGCDGDNGADDDEEDDGFVEQEGCPEDTDLKKWSHHTSVSTCDDDLLRRAVGDDDTISFVFGCEINWDLLKQKDEDEREEREMRKEQARLDLLELNEKRDAEKRKKTNEETALAEKHAARKAKAAAAAAAEAAAAAAAAAGGGAGGDDAMEAVDLTSPPHAAATAAGGAGDGDGDDDNDEEEIEAKPVRPKRASPVPAPRSHKASRTERGGAASLALGDEDESDEDASDFIQSSAPKPKAKDKDKVKAKSKSNDSDNNSSNGISKTNGDKDKKSKDKDKEKSKRKSSAPVGPVSFLDRDEDEDEDDMNWKEDEDVGGNALAAAARDVDDLAVSKAKKAKKRVVVDEDEDEDDAPVPAKASAAAAAPKPVPAKALKDEDDDDDDCMQVQAPAAPAAAPAAVAAPESSVPIRREDGTWDCLHCSFTNPEEWDSECCCCSEPSGLPKRKRRKT